MDIERFFLLSWNCCSDPNLNQKVHSGPHSAFKELPVVETSYIPTGHLKSHCCSLLALSPTPPPHLFPTLTPQHWFFKARPSQAFLKATFVFSPLVWSLPAFVQCCPVVSNFVRQHSVVFETLASGVDSGIQSTLLCHLLAAWLGPTYLPCWTLLFSIN